ncbi:basic leucine zipper transcriptional factor ATF-like 3 [Suncus etruscus]|uniref:basic leucine zipper transcriptional factor ATF-like 3 n=1 Tax=Suncus etruscus TaxID=109475 RepID=UPI00211055E9|nr:basic leucine zipper transcriptional factor ATF-like 3 [Suncus etruscus]
MEASLSSSLKISFHGTRPVRFLIPKAATPRAGAQAHIYWPLPLSHPFPLQSPEDDDDRKVRRREKNRVAAQRSRKKQTQKADRLHEEHESLEQENTALRREIGALTEERQRLSEALREHEKRCPLLLSLNFPSTPRPDPAGCLPR